MADVLILTGPPGAGKSSVAEALADRYDRVAHIWVDGLRHFVTATGYIAPGRPGFERQQALATRNACDLASNYIEDRFAVIIDDVVVTTEDVSRYLAGLEPAGVPVHLVRLLPSLEVCLARNDARKADRIQPQRVEAVYRDFVVAGEHMGVTIDSSELTVEATADRLQALTTSGQSIIWSRAS